MDKSEKNLVWIFVALGICFVIGCAFLFTKEKKVEEVELAKVVHTENLEVDLVNGINVEHEYVPYDSRRRPGEVREILYITIHETDNRRSGSGANAHKNFLSGNNSDITGWHYTVDDGSIVHHIPDNEIAWNAGDGRSELGGNMNGIGIEMCVNVDNDYEKTVENTAALVVALLRAYDLEPKDVRFHEDFMNKECPHRLISEGRLDDFYKMVIEAYSKNQFVEMEEVE